MIIYKITNIITGKIYVGLTSVSLRERWTNHKSNCKNPAKYTSALYCSMRKYGVENFKIDVIDTATTLDELNTKEKTYIKALNSLVPNGYNLDDGGGSQNCHEETRAKISAALKGRPITNRYTGGNKAPRTEEQKAHLSNLNKGIPNKALYKRIRAVETGTVYESVNAAAKALGVNRATISGLLKSGKQGRLGLSFRYEL